MTRWILFLLCLTTTGLSYGQLGGRKSFEFLNLPVGAKAAGLGGVVASSTQSDVTLFMSNPSLLDSANHNHVSWSYLGFYADVKYNSFAYARNFERAGLFAIGVQHLGYGEIQGFDLIGNETETFKAGETALTISKSHQIGPFSMGANLKFISSNMDSFGSNALAADLGGSFIHPEREFMVSLLFKNFGAVLTEYTENSESELPTDVQIGLTFKPEHMPFRFTLTGYNLNKSYGTFYDESLEGEEKPSTADEFFRHVNVGLEVVLGKNVNLRGGYNHLVRKELGQPEVNGLTGFSLGFMARIKAFELSYAFTTYHVDSGRSYLTITSNLNRVFKKKSIL